MPFDSPSAAPVGGVVGVLLGGGVWGGGGATTDSNGKGQGHVIKTNGYGAEF